jgi:hypothetical protein
LEYHNIFLKIISRGLERKWVDIEKEYYQQVLSLLKTHKSKGDYEEIGKLNEDFEKIKNALEKYLERVVNQGIILDEYIKHNIYDNIEPNEITSIGNNIRKQAGDIEQRNTIRNIRNHERIEDLSQSQDDKIYLKPKSILFLNFNYSPTAKQYLNGEGESEILHIHGELNNPDNPIIFGYGDELDDKYPSIEKTNDNRFLENMKYIKYMRTDNHKKLLNFI